jgi:integrase
LFSTFSNPYSNLTPGSTGLTPGSTVPPVRLHRRAQVAAPVFVDPRRAAFEVAIDRDYLARCGEAWLEWGDSKGFATRTQQVRADAVARLLWFLDREGAKECTYMELRCFMDHLWHGHKEPEGRWGTPDLMGRHLKPLRPLTVHRFWRDFHAWFAWMEREELLPVSPMRVVDAPEKKQEPIRYLTREQLQSLVDACAKSSYPDQDAAILAPPGHRPAPLGSLRADLRLH